MAVGAGGGRQQEQWFVNVTCKERCCGAAVGTRSIWRCSLQLWVPVPDVREGIVRSGCKRCATLGREGDVGHCRGMGGGSLEPGYKAPEAPKNIFGEWDEACLEHHRANRHGDHGLDHGTALEDG